MQPARQGRMPGELRRLSGQRHKYHLGDVFGGLSAAHQTQRGRINEINVSPHDFGKGAFRTPAGIFTQQLLIA